MNAAQHYHAFLGLHVLAVVMFVGGTVLLAAMLPSLSRDGGSSPGSRATLLRLRRWNSFVTLPAMVLVWVFGLTLAAAGGWFVAPWLQAKMALVAVVSAIHGSLSARLRRIANAVGAAQTVTWRPALAIALLVIAILVLVLVKP